MEGFCHPFVIKTANEQILEHLQNLDNAIKSQNTKIEALEKRLKTTQDNIINAASDLSNVVAG